MCFDQIYPPFSLQIPPFPVPFPISCASFSLSFLSFLLCLFISLSLFLLPSFFSFFQHTEFPFCCLYMLLLNLKCFCDYLT